jgi:hypothetical protein
MRQWILARVTGRGPADSLSRLFSARGMADALTPFDAAMTALDRRSSEELAFRRPCDPHVDDVEAVLLAIWRAVFDRRDARAHRSLALIVDAAAAREMANSMARVCSSLQRLPGGGAAV